MMSSTVREIRRQHVMRAEGVAVSAQRAGNGVRPHLNPHPGAEEARPHSGLYARLLEKFLGSFVPAGVRS